MNKHTHVAIDLGASSGRHVLGWLEDGKMQLKEMYRFENGAAMKNGYLCWDHAQLTREIIAGLKACREAGEMPETVAIDTWGVDYALMDEEGHMLSDTFAYRDSRTKETWKSLDDDAVYARTGIQPQPFNTIYQLLADQENRPADLEKAARLLFMPEYLTYCLTGKMESEYTIASTSGLLNAKTRDWDWELIDELKLPRGIFGPLRQPGFAVGPVTEAIEKEIGYKPTVLLAPAHDTAAAVLGAPLEKGDAFLSSGTWSLLGAEIDTPILTREARLCGITNEGGVEGTYRFLKNIMGLWIIQNIRKELPGKPSFGDMAKWAKENEAFSGRIDVDAPEFLAPANMTEAIYAYLESHNQPKPQNAGELLACVNHSLAESYAKTIQHLGHLVGQPFKRLCIVGGGSQNQFLNELTAKACGIPVTAGPTEGTAIGNLLCQMLSAGEIASVSEARALLKESFEIKEVVI
ncbi:MAG: rhamnulokinase [Clostridiales bacterium]|nr:rhamnulokinase [Clostridiales bacterium]